MRISFQALLSLLLFAMCLRPLESQGQPLGPSQNFPQWSDPVHAWADYDLDGDPDLFLSGRNALGQSQSAIFKLSSNSLAADPLQHIAAVTEGSAAWADFDADGDPDLAIMGDTLLNRPCLVIYRNNSGVLSPLPQYFLGRKRGSLVWADLDGDGDPDLLAGGWHPTQGGIGTVFWNQNGSFSPMDFPPLGQYDAPSIAAGDFDGDGKTDLAIGGKVSPGLSGLSIMRNLGAGQWSSLQPQGQGIALGSLQFAQLIPGGGSELLVNGQQNGVAMAALTWQNGQVAPVPGIPNGTLFGPAVALDVDLDNDLDILGFGLDGALAQCKFYRGASTGYSQLQAPASLPALYNVCVSIVDWNLDQYPDIHLTGKDVTGNDQSYLLTYDPTLQQFIQ